MARLLLLIVAACVAGCSQADELKPSPVGSQQVAAPTNNHRDTTVDEPKLWPISVEGKWGFIDAAGNVKIAIQYAKAEPFREGLALVSVFGTSKDDLEKNRSYDGFIDESGQFVIPAEFPAFINREHYFYWYAYSSFEDGVAVVHDAGGTFGERGLIDRQGNLIAPMIEQSLDYFGEGLCSFERSKKRGYMDYRGNVVITPKGFLYGTEFSEGRAVITVRKNKDDQEFMIDRQGNVIVGPDKYTSLGRIHGGLASVMKDGTVGLIDRDGRVAVPFGEYDRIMDPDRGTTFLGEKHGVYYALRANAEAVKLPDFGVEPIRFCDELILLRTNDRKAGFAKVDGTIVVEPVFNALISFDGELCKFHRAPEQGYVNRSGKVVWSTMNWELPLKYSIREPLQSYLPNFGLEALPLSYNWDCKNAIVFVCDGNVQKLREYYLSKRSSAVKVKDWTNFESEPGKVDIWLYFEGVSKLEVYAMHGDDESKDGEETNNFIGFYSCKNMDALRKKFPGKTIGIVIEN